MLIPRYWSESWQTLRVGKNSTRLRRFGWSSESQQAADQHARERLQEAIRAIQSGTKIREREDKIPYNGADGLPIREEIVAEHPNAVITRNSYGALCLNTPNVLFADIDFPEDSSGVADKLLPVLFFCGLLGGNLLKISWLIIGGLICLGLYAIIKIYRRLWIHQIETQYTRCMNALEEFAARHPQYRFIAYQTPAGFRLLFLHALYDPRSPEVKAIFQELKVDPQYARMCHNQACFRARLTPKPWRMGMKNRFSRPAVWPVQEKLQPKRKALLEEYNQRAGSYAACRFLKEWGEKNAADPTALGIQQLHDDLAHARTDLPLA
ncbi:MAG: hypothetical protein SFY68_07175 [Candidatus Sumerlaeia bacterium]|nr:hypothetical protein [Candidatus Sumerlaeia bacterium]